MKNLSSNKELIKECIVEIATPFSTGTGFYIKSFDVIVTNEHVIRDNKSVIIKGPSFEKQMAEVLLIDEYADIAFLSAPITHNMPDIKLRLVDPLKQGDQVTAMGHPYGLKFSLTEGVVSSVEQKDRDLELIMHDAALNPGNSGGPLVDANGLVVGINSFVLRDGENLGFALPIEKLHAVFSGFDTGTTGTVVRCQGCRKFVSDQQNDLKYCDYCGAEVLFPSQIQPYSPVGVAKIIEDIISDLGYDARLTREGRNHWNIQRGSALVRLSYHMATGLIDGDAYLCRLPEDNVDAIYTFLLQENLDSKGLVLSVYKQFVLLSLLIYDRHLDEETGKIMLERLFERSDEYDDILIERFGASWIDQL